MEDSFFQEPPSLKNTFLVDTLLQAFLKKHLPKDLHKNIFADLTAFGESCAGRIRLLGVQAERNPPRHRPYGPFGRRIDEIEVHPAWDELKNISSREGLISIGYERKQKEYSRLYQFAKLYLFHPSSAFFSCPLAMADGAAKVLETYAGDNRVLRDAFAHLTSRDPAQFWTSGQWMTEKTGGSDVSETSTIARKQGDKYLLSGTKWFTSSITSEMALGLGRIEGAPQGSKGLSLFYIPVRHDGVLNGIRVLRLKDKMGTKALPTSELELDRTEAYLVSEEGHGVKTVATMLNITRLHNSVCSIGQMARSFQIARDYAGRRTAFGAKILEHPLHAQTLVRMRLETNKSIALTLALGVFLGKEETNTASEGELYLLRLLTPVAKLSTARAAVDVSTDMLEAIGGAGYVEDTEVPVLVRDAHVLPIWEGTTNVLSLDVLRVIEKKGIAPFFTEMRERMNDKFPLYEKVKSAFEAFEKSVGELLKGPAANTQRSACVLAFALRDWFVTFELLELYGWMATTAEFKDVWPLSSMIEDLVASLPKKLATPSAYSGTDIRNLLRLDF